MLENTIERIHVGKQYGDIHRGVFIVRGENVVLLGEVVCLVVFLSMFGCFLCAFLFCHYYSVIQLCYHTIVV